MFHCEHLRSNRTRKTSSLQTTHKDSLLTVCVMLAGARDHCGLLSFHCSSWIQVPFRGSAGRGFWESSNGLLCCHATYAGHARGVTVSALVHCMAPKKGTDRVCKGSISRNNLNANGRGQCLTKPFFLRQHIVFKNFQLVAAATVALQTVRALFCVKNCHYKLSRVTSP